MALASRSARRSGAGSRWLLIGVVITLFVLLINASLQSRSPGPGQQLAAGAWLDRALPIITTSTEEGQQLAAIWTNGLKTPASTLDAQLNQVAGGAAAAYQQIIGLRPPTNVAAAAGLLEASLLVRSQAAAAVRDALHPVLDGTGSPVGVSSSTDPTNLTAIQNAGGEMEVADQAYRLFVQSLPSLGVSMPQSVWVTDPAPYQPAQATVFLSSLRSAMSSTPVHQIKIYALSTAPGPESSNGTVEVLPDSRALAVTVVLADVGNQPEKNLTVTAAISPGGVSSSVRDFLSLVPGQAQSIVGMGPLTPPQGVNVTLTVTVTSPADPSSTPLATSTLTFTMPAPPTATTTTTTVGTRG
jgi:hypothetical protein